MFPWHAGPWPLGTDRRWHASRTRHWSGRGSRDAADPLTERQSRRARTQATPLEPEGARPPEKTERLSRLISSANDGSRVLISYSTHKARCAREAHRRMPSDDSLQKPSPARRRSAPMSVQCLPISPDRDRPDDQGEGGDRPQFGKRSARIGEVRLGSWRGNAPANLVTAAAGAMVPCRRGTATCSIPECRHCARR